MSEKKNADETLEIIRKFLTAIKMLKIFFIVHQKFIKDNQNQKLIKENQRLKKVLQREQN